MLSTSKLKNEQMEVILERKALLWKAKASRPWLVVNLLILALIIYDINQGSCTRFFKGQPMLLWCGELFLLAIFASNVLFNLILCFNPAFLQSSINVTPEQKKLYGLDDLDTSFKCDSPMTIKNSTSPSLSSTPKTPFIMPSLQCSSSFSHSFLSSTPVDYSGNSWIASNSSSSLSTSSSSWMFHAGTPSPSFQSGFDNPLKPHVSPVQPNFDRSGVRRRIISPSQETITDSKELEQYLRAHDEKEQQQKRGLNDLSGGSRPSFWNYHRTVADYAPLLKKYRYQTATRSPQSTSSLKDDPDSPSSFSEELIWSRLKMPEDKMNEWIGNIRKWLSQTVLVEVVKEIDSVNDMQRRLGSSDFLIGEVSIDTVRQIALAKSEQLPKLSALVPYLDLTSHQDYLVKRLRELSSGGCISDFRWNGGSDYRGKPWSDFLPTDGAIIMHMFCTYMDACLPTNPYFLDGRMFTAQYFKKIPNAPETRKDTPCIFQSKLSPSHYCFLVGDSLCDLPKGRNNVFYAILVFLHYVKTKNYGVLDRISLGPTGVNILCVFETSRTP